jgi:hypothetical protein
MSIIHVGKSLDTVGIITDEFLIGLIHDRIAPDIIAIDDKIIIGVLIFFSS